MSKGGKLSPSDFSDDTRKLIRSAVEAALPKSPDKDIGESLFDLARRLKAIPEVAGYSAEALGNVLAGWHKKAVQIVAGCTVEDAEYLFNQS